jgi:hypothetical protein
VSVDGSHVFFTVPVETELYDLLDVAPNANEGCSPASGLNIKRGLMSSQHAAEIKKAYRRKVRGMCCNGDHGALI